MDKNLCWNLCLNRSYAIDSGVRPVIYFDLRRSGGMADATDSKSVGSDTVSVQVRPPAPPRDSTNDRMISICCWVSCLFGVSKSVDISRDLALLDFMFLRHFKLKIASQNQFRVSFRKYVKKPISNSFALPRGVHFPLK